LKKILIFDLEIKKVLFFTEEKINQ